MYPSLTFVVSAWIAIASLATAQTFTSCNPTNTTCPSDIGLSSKTFSTDFTQGQSASWVPDHGTTVTYSDLGVAFTVNTKSDTPTIQTNFYIFFGYVEVTMRAAPGTGIVSAIVLLSDDLDEIDWECLGSYPNDVQTNFFGKGNTTLYNHEQNASVASTTTEFHTYALNWTSSSLEWIIDGTTVRTLKYTDSLALGGKNYPQSPSRVKLGNWPGGASASPGTVAWAGGATNFNDGPFTMYVESVTITNYNPGSEYTYSDMSGDYPSIKIGGSDISAAGKSLSSSSSSLSSSSASSSTATVVKSGSTTTTKSDTTTSSLSPSSSSITSVTVSTSASASTSATKSVQSTSDARRHAQVYVWGNWAHYLTIASLASFML